MRSWSGASSITYALPNAAPTNTGSLPTEASGIVALTPHEKAQAELAFTLWDDLIPKSLVEINGTSANIVFNYSNKTSQSGTYASATFSSNPGGTDQLKSEQIWINSDWSSNQDQAILPESYGNLAYIHEIGHSLGLSHPGTYDAASSNTPTFAHDAVYADDNRQFSVMSYFGGYDASTRSWASDGTLSNWLYPDTPMVDDIAAIQALYGADTSTRTGDTTYGFNCSLSSADPERAIYDFSLNATPIYTIWDAGGHNTLDCSGYSGKQIINLTQGSYSSVDGLTDNVGIAYGCVIDKGIGGAGDDILISGRSSDTLTGGGGNDLFEGSVSNFQGDTVTDFTLGDKIDLTDMAYRAGGSSGVPTATVCQFDAASHTLTVSDATSAANATCKFSLSGSFAGNNFVLSSDGSTGTLITLAAPSAVPVILGTSISTTKAEAAVTPFSGVRIADANTGATDTVVIALTGVGGTLTGNGLTRGADGSYSLAAGDPASVTAQLQALVFTPEAGLPYTLSVTDFKLTVASSVGTVATDSGVVVTDYPAPATPTVAGTHASTVVSESVATPFSGVTVTDPNSGASDTATIVLSGDGGVLAGAGLTHNADGSYTLASAPASKLSSQLQALTFVPTRSPSDPTATTTFALSVTSSTGTVVTDGGSSVVDVDPVVKPTVAFDATTSGFLNGRTPVLTGTASSPNGSVWVEIFDGDPSQGGQDLGAAAVDGNGHWVFSTDLGPGDFGTLTAVATDEAGNTASAAAPYELLTAIVGSPYRAFEYDYGSDQSYGYTEYGRGGRVLVTGSDNGQGQHEVQGFANRQQIFSIYDDIMTGGGNNETFTFNPDFGRDEIVDFKVAGPAHDVVDLSNTSYGSLHQVLNHTTMSDGNATIHLDPRNSITLDGVTKAQLMAHPAAFALAG